MRIRKSIAMQCVMRLVRSFIIILAEVIYTLTDLLKKAGTLRSAELRPDISPFCFPTRRPVATISENTSSNSENEIQIQSKPLGSAAKDEKANRRNTAMDDFDDDDIFDDFISERALCSLPFFFFFFFFSPLLP